MTLLDKINLELCENCTFYNSPNGYYREWYFINYDKQIAICIYRIFPNKIDSEIKISDGKLFIEAGVSYFNIRTRLPTIKYILIDENTNLIYDTSDYGIINIKEDKMLYQIIQDLKNENSHLWDT